MTELDAVIKYLFACHCVKSVRIRSFSGSYFPAFGLNIEEERENMHTFNAVSNRNFCFCYHFFATDMPIRDTR